MAITNLEAPKEKGSEGLFLAPELALNDPEGRYIGHAWLSSPEQIAYIDGMKLQVDGRTVTLLQDPLPPAEDDTEHAMSIQNPTTDRELDARLSGIENKLDANLALIRDRQDADAGWTKEIIGRIEKQSEQAEARFEKACTRHDAELALQRQKTDESYRNLYNLIDGTRKHASNMAAVTIFGTVGGVLAALALVVTLGAGWISEQGSYARSYGETQVELQRGADERAETREALQSIQSTQQTIIDRLPSPETQ